MQVHVCMRCLYACVCVCDYLIYHLKPYASVCVCVFSLFFFSFFHLFMSFLYPQKPTCLCFNAHSHCYYCSYSQSHSPSAYLSLYLLQLSCCLKVKRFKLYTVIYVCRYVIYNVYLCVCVYVCKVLLNAVYLHMTI